MIKTDSARPSCAASPTTGAAADRFEDLGEIARGGMGVVRRVFDREMLRQVAMKVLLNASDEPDLLARFVEEAQVMGQLDHPNIVPVYDLARDDRGFPTRFTMKLVEGTTLRQMLEDRRDPPVVGHDLEEMLYVFVKVCDAVSFAHSRGVVHQDLNPRNIMVGSHGQVYVMDWGLALVRRSLGAAGEGDGATLPSAHEGDAFDGTASLAGTPTYMAPEQAWGRPKEIDARTDVFGLGGILYEFLTLRPPYPGPGLRDALEQARAARIAYPSEFVDPERLPMELCRIAMKALAPRSTDRYQTVDELKAAVEAFLRGGGWFATVTFPAGTLIVREGEPGDVAYIVTEGLCEVYRIVGGRKDVLRRVGPGEIVGEIALVTASPRVANVEATTDVTTRVVSRSALEHELARNTWMRVFVEAAVARFAELDRSGKGRK